MRGWLRAAGESAQTRALASRGIVPPKLLSWFVASARFTPCYRMRLNAPIGRHQRFIIIWSRCIIISIALSIMSRRLSINYWRRLLPSGIGPPCIGPPPIMPIIISPRELRVSPINSAIWMQCSVSRCRHSAGSLVACISSIKFCISSRCFCIRSLCICMLCSSNLPMCVDTDSCCAAKPGPTRSAAARTTEVSIGFMNVTGEIPSDSCFIADDGWLSKLRTKYANPARRNVPALLGCHQSRNAIHHTARDQDAFNVGN